MPFVSGFSALTIVEFSGFRRDADALVEPEELDDLRTLLAWTPDFGALIPGTGGVRKLRFGLAQRKTGKRGGARVIYYYHDRSMPLAMLAIYAKGEKADLSAAEKKEIRALVAAYVAAQKTRQRLESP